jgi:hypothetical protein
LRRRRQLAGERQHTHQTERDGCVHGGVAYPAAQNDGIRLCMWILDRAGHRAVQLRECPSAADQAILAEDMQRGPAYSGARGF